MYFDWITWSIWLIGLAIMVIWIIIPVKEFRKLLREKHRSHKEKTGSK